MLRLTINQHELCQYLDARGNCMYYPVVCLCAFLPATLPTRHLDHTFAVPRIWNVVISIAMDTSAMLPPSSRRRCRTTVPASNASNCWGPCAIHLERCRVPAAAYLTSCRPSTGRQRWWSRWTRPAGRGCSKWQPPPLHCYSLSFCWVFCGRVVGWGRAEIPAKCVWFVDTRVCFANAGDEVGSDKGRRCLRISVDVLAIYVRSRDGVFGKWKSVLETGGGVHWADEFITFIAGLSNIYVCDGFISWAL